MDSEHQLLQTNQTNSLGKNSICMCAFENIAPEVLHVKGHSECHI